MDNDSGRTPREMAAEIAQELIDEKKFFVHIRGDQPGTFKEYEVPFKEFRQYLHNTLTEGMNEAIIEVNAGVGNPDSKISLLVDVLDKVADPEKALNRSDALRLQLGLEALEKIKSYINVESLKWEKYYDGQSESGASEDVSKSKGSLRQYHLVVAGMWEIETKLYTIMEKLSILPKKDISHNR